MPTVRDADGLALSSRNAYLRPASARGGLAARRAARRPRRLRGGRARRGAPARGRARDRLAVEPEYVELRERDDLGPYDPDLPAVLALAARVGRARLIDNVTNLIPREEPREHPPAVPAPGIARPRQASLPELRELKAAAARS